MQQTDVDHIRFGDGSRIARKSHLMHASVRPKPSVNGSVQNISILGSTGSIGTQALEVIRHFRGLIRVKALSAFSNAELLGRQALEFRPEYVVIQDAAGYEKLRGILSGTGIRILQGRQGLVEVASMEGVDTILAAVVGYAGLESVLAAIRNGKRIALANKETMVVAGALVNEMAQKYGATIIPVDSEHSAIFQCLIGEPDKAIESLILTASGGPFRTRSLDTFGQITIAEALQHPNWSMGAKITVDSATMMNKGLEVIEAHWLFGVDSKHIHVLIHPQSIIHSMVTFKDGSTKAQLGVPDMKVPIQYALSYPDRWESPNERIDWSVLQHLEFEQPDTEKFPCIRLAYDALWCGGTAPAILNAANEEAVALFLKEQIRFTDIPILIENALEMTSSKLDPTLEALIEVDGAARRCVKEHRHTVIN